MNKNTKSLLLRGIPALVVLVVCSCFAIRYVNPAPPRHLVIATGDGEGDYQSFAKLYEASMKQEGIQLELRTTHGALDNIRLLVDEKSDVQAAFVQDGLLTGDQTDHVLSLGSLYYEPLWIFYSNKIELPHKVDLTKLSQLRGKRIGIGEEGSGTSVLAQRLLKASGVDSTNSIFVHQAWEDSEKDLRDGEIDVSFLVATAEDPMVERLLADSDIHLMSLDQAEGIQAQLPFLHHLTLYHGSVSLAKNLPEKDIQMIAPTATLLVKDSIHPALQYLLLKAASGVHDDPGIFEKKNEFPSDKDYEVTVSSEAKQFYKNGIPFWQKYLPFWLATFAERLLVIAVPFFAFVLPTLKLIPRFIRWRDRNKILGRYAELKLLENRIRSGVSKSLYDEHIAELARIEEKVNRLKLPIEYANDVYGLRSHIQFVRERVRGELG